MICFQVSYFLIFSFFFSKRNAGPSMPVFKGNIFFRKTGISLPLSARRFYFLRNYVRLAECCFASAGASRSIRPNASANHTLPRSNPLCFMLSLTQHHLLSDGVSFCCFLLPNLGSSASWRHFWAFSASEALLILTSLGSTLWRFLLPPIG